jgi:segregation and condensation protein B
MTDHQLALLEATLFASSKPLSLEDLAKLTKINIEKLPGMLESLSQRYASQDHGIAVANLGGWRFAIKSEFAPRMSSMTKPDLPKGLLRVLSMIAYHEPVKQSDIVKIIGNRTYEYIKHLKELNFIIDEKHARTKLLKVTPYFETYFATKKEDLKKALKPDEKEKQPKAQPQETDKNSAPIREKQNI